jgi:hypothetical protein
MKTSKTELLVKSIVLGLMLIVILASCSEDGDNPTPVDNDSSYSDDELPLEVDPLDLYLKVQFGINDIEATTGNYGESYHGSNHFDLYDPIDNEEEARPLILLCPGGAWTRYTRQLELQAMARDLARRGYVVAVIRYAVAQTGWDTIEEFGALVLDGVHDQKAAIRYFKNNAEEYRIDPDKVFLGGWSTGAHLSILTAYWDEDDIADFQSSQQDLMEPLITTRGLEGDMNPGASSEIKGTLLMMPVALELNVFDAGEPKMMLIHHSEAEDLSHQKNIGVYPVSFGSFSANWFGSDKISEEIEGLGILDTYIRPTDVPANPPQHYANLDPMSEKYYDQIAEYFYNNLD